MWRRLIERIRDTRLEFKVLILAGLFLAVVNSVLPGGGSEIPDITRNLDRPDLFSPEGLRTLVIAGAFVASALTFVLSLPIFLFSSNQERSNNAGELVKTTLAFFVGALTVAVG